MIPPAASPPRIRLMKSTVRLGASADATRQSARTAVATLISTAFPTASPVGPRSGWLVPNGSAMGEESRATTPTVVANSAAIDVTSGSRRRVARAPEKPQRDRIHNGPPPSYWGYKRGHFHHHHGHWGGPYPGLTPPIRRGRTGIHTSKVVPSAMSWACSSPGTRRMMLTSACTPRSSTW